MSKTDWRMRAISASTLHLRTNQIFVNSDDIKEIVQEVEEFFNEDSSKVLSLTGKNIITLPKATLKYVL